MEFDNTINLHQIYCSNTKFKVSLKSQNFLYPPLNHWLRKLVYNFLSINRSAWGKCPVSSSYESGTSYTYTY